MLRAGETVLGELEVGVLEHLWSAGEADAKDVHRALGRRRGVTLNTIQSTLKRLFEKGILERRKVSHAHVYAARLTREEVGRDVLEGVMADLLRGEPSAMVAAFVDLVDRAGDEQLDELERAIRERRRARGKR